MPETSEDWYIVVPVLPMPDGAVGAGALFLAKTDDMDVAAQVAHDHGFPQCVVVLGHHYKKAGT